MIVGHGDLASVLPKDSDLLFFASGVSNSQETRKSEYMREIHLLMKQNKNKHIVYFSSLAVFYSDTKYAIHKRFMEQTVKRAFQHHTIIRLGNITWGNNPTTIINFFRDQTNSGVDLEIRDEYRYIIDKDEFLHWVSLIPSWNCEMNCPGQRLKINEIVDKYVYPRKDIN